MDKEKIPAFTTNWPNLAAARLGAAADSATDEFFGDKSRLLNEQEPVFIADKYDEHGKWMDGWETRRRREPGHDHCVIRLATRGIIHGLDIDTRHFTGNYPQAASIDISDGPDGPWVEALGQLGLSGNHHHYLPLSGVGPATHVRLNIYPDGGIARFRVYGEPVFDWSQVPSEAEIELSAFAHGGRIIAYNDAHYGSPWAILTPGRGVDMGDGWETRRRRSPGNDWIIVSLGTTGRINRIEVDTAHFKGNYPGACSISAALMADGTEATWAEAAEEWPVLLPKKELGADAIHEFYRDSLEEVGEVNAVRLNIYPDGGVSRFRLFGTKS
ncbi:MAG: allantoicase [Magnetospiraceae bacterium]